MSCFFAPTGWYGANKNPKTGKRPIVFQLHEAYSPTRVRLHCGRCPGCLKYRAQQWAIRIIHEKRMGSKSAFVTLTYSPANLPENASLVKSDLQKFMKRLRKTRPQGLRFFACGEYGETMFRPHYHIWLLNTDFPDRRYWKKSAAGSPLYVSAELGQLWQYGDGYIGEVSIGSALYVANYMLKGSYHPPNTEAPFQLMSRRPGLGSSWYDTYAEESYRHDDVIVDGRSRQIPRYYDTKLAKTNPALLEKVKLQRRRSMLTPAARVEKTPERQRFREEYILQSRKHDKLRDPT